MGQNFPEVMALFSHGVGSVLAHAHPMAKALGRNAYLSRLQGNGDGGGPQTQEAPQLGTGKGLPANIHGVHTAAFRIGCLPNGH